jgi:hypothetical protein
MSFKFRFYELIYKASGMAAAWIYNKLFLANRHFRIKAHARDVFVTPGYSSFFVMLDAKPDGGLSDMTSVEPFPKDLVEVVRVDELHEVAYKSYMNGVHS